MEVETVVAEEGVQEDHEKDPGKDKIEDPEGKPAIETRK